jgi:DNA gyrase/topoisomerase IV subunit A
LRKAREREHILLGFQKALDNLDEVIKLIRAAKTPKEAREGLITKFEFTERQAQAIIELQLQRLTGMEQQRILEELAEIQVKIAEYMEILGSEKTLRNLIIKELREVQKDFGDERRTQIVEDTGEIKLEDLVQWRTSRSRSRAAGTLSAPRSILIAADTRRQGTDRHVDACRGCGRAPDRRVDARLFAGLYQ